MPEKWIERQHMFKEELEDFQQMLDDATEEIEIAILKAEIAQTEMVLTIFRTALGERS